MRYLVRAYRKTGRLGEALRLASQVKPVYSHPLVRWLSELTVLEGQLCNPDADAFRDLATRLEETYEPASTFHASLITALRKPEPNVEGIEAELDKVYY